MTCPCDIEELKVMMSMTCPCDILWTKSNAPKRACGIHFGNNKPTDNRHHCCKSVGLYFQLSILIRWITDFCCWGGHLLLQCKTIVLIIANCYLFLNLISSSSHCAMKSLQLPSNPNSGASISVLLILMDSFMFHLLIRFAAANLSSTLFVNTNTPPFHLPKPSMFSQCIKVLPIRRPSLSIRTQHLPFIL